MELFFFYWSQWLPCRESISKIHSYAGQNVMDNDILANVLECNYKYNTIKLQNIQA